MPSSDLIELVDALVVKFVDTVPPDVRRQLEAVRIRLREPARVAVVGPVNSGKSTVVNALIGQRVAPTDVSECTRVVSWFRYGHPQRVEILMKDGRRIDAQLDGDGALPRQLPVPVDEVASLQCFLANDSLRTLTLVDTPGLGSVRTAYSTATVDFLGAKSSADATQQADAVVFLFSHSMMADEFEALELFREGGGMDGGRSAASSVGLLSKADQVGDGSRDPWLVSVELASNLAGRFSRDVATVVPVIGLLAETSETAALTEQDANHLVELAGMDSGALEVLLWSADRFVQGQAPVSNAARERLITLLDLYGVEQAVGLIRAGAVGAASLRRELSARSGISSVKHTLDTYFREQDHLLKVRSALRALEGLSSPQFSDAQRAALRAGVEELRLDPVMHPVLELEAWHDCCSGRVGFEPERLEEVARLFRPGRAATRLGASPDDELADLARARLTEWQKFLVTEATPAQAKVARIVRRSYQLIWTQLQHGGEGR